MGRAKAARAEQTGRERAAASALADRVARARAATPPRDPTGEHHEALGELARSRGLDAGDLVDEWSARAAAREYMGGVTRAEAERAAATDVIEAYGNRQGALL